MLAWAPSYFSNLDAMKTALLLDQLGLLSAPEATALPTRLEQLRTHA